MTLCLKNCFIQVLHGASNQNLKQICQWLGIGLPFVTYVPT